MQIKTLKQALLAASVIALLAAGYGRFGAETISPAHALAPTRAASAAPPAAAAGTAAMPGFSNIVAQYGPAVVNISVSGTVKTAATGAPFPRVDPGDPFYEFFKRFRVPAPQGEAPIGGQGSGFIVRPDGLILTNAHVVNGADEVTVKLTNKQEYKARVLGIDKPSDVAVVKIDAKDLPTVKLGDPAQTQVGEWVLAIGSPFGFENSATAGIVSAKSRSLPDEGYVAFLQTDVAVNPGNSGGPLFNMNGEVIGINSQIYSRTGGYQGLSFAIPIDVALKVEQQIVRSGKVERGRLGVGIQEVSPSLADSFGLKKPAGALVGSVAEGSPAARAGLAPGDIILKLNGEEIASSNQLPPLVADLKPGSAAKLEIWRKGGTREIVVTVGQLQDDKVATNDSPATQGRLGLSVRPLTPDERGQAGSGDGLLVEEAAGAAARAGILPGDIVLSLNGEPIKNAAQLRTLAAKAGKHVALLVQRGDARIFVPIDLG